VNDVSLYQGGSFQPDHDGHQAGMQIDIRPPRLDGDTTQGTTVGAATYDRDAMRAILEAFREEGDIADIFLNDATLIAEGLCTSLAGHDDHAHVAVAPPNRR
jgi:hypothetical protein